MSRIHGIERRIDELLRGLLRSSLPEQRRELIEVHRAILEEVASRVVTLPRGKLGFGHSHIRIEIFAEPEQRASYERVFLKGAALEHQIRTSFQERGVEYPDRLKVEIELVADLPADAKGRGFDISYSNLSATTGSAQPREIRLTVLAGAAEQSEYRFQKQRVNIGRLPEVLDGQLRPIRRNDLALKDGAAGVNATVSRTHAHLEWDTEAARFRLFDDGSAHGTTLVREGSLIPVPTGASKGVLLQTHDQIIVGQAHIRFEYIDAESQSP
jgi:hypothetical protein